MILVIGYGNDLRRDDGIGPQVARIVASWKRPGLESMATHGLMPELAEPISRAERVVFVDARQDTPLDDGEVLLRHIIPDETAVADAERKEPMTPVSGFLGHTSSPEWLLELAEAVYGRAPPACLVTIPASDFGYGEGFSPRALVGIQSVLAMIGQWTNRLTPEPA